MTMINEIDTTSLSSDPNGLTIPEHPYYSLDVFLCPNRNIKGL